VLGRVKEQGVLLYMYLRFCCHAVLCIFSAFLGEVNSWFSCVEGLQLLGASLPDCSPLSLLGCCCKLFMANAKFLALASLQALALAAIMYRARDWQQVQRLLGTAPACGSPSEFVIVSRHVVTPDGTFPAAGMLLVSEAFPTYKAGLLAGLLCTSLHFLNTMLVFFAHLTCHAHTLS